MILAGGDGACHLEVLDGSSVDVAEGCEALIAVIVKCDSDGVAVAEEGAAEGLVVAVARMRSHWGCNVNIGGEFHVLAIVVVAVVDVVDKIDPFVAVADGVGVARRAGGGDHVVGAADEDAIGVCLHHAVVLNEAAEVGRSGGCGVGLLGAADGAGVSGFADLRVHVVAVGDGARSALQAHGVHGRDVGVGAGLKAVHEGWRSAVAPSPEAADVAAVAVHAVDGAGEGAAPDGGGRTCDTDWRRWYPPLSGS